VGCYIEMEGDEVMIYLLRTEEGTTKIMCNAELSREPATSDLMPPISWVERACNSSGHPKILLLGKICWTQAGFEPALRGA
jgi:hypothetical protein